MSDFCNESLHDLQYKWTYIDIMKANAILDHKEAFANATNQIDYIDSKKS